MKPKQEQINEIAKTMCKEFGTDLCGNECECANEFIAKNLYKAGYRKASEVIDEFVERLKAKESPKLLAWEYGEGYLDCIKTADELADEMRKEVEK